MKKLGMITLAALFSFSAISCDSNAAVEKETIKPVEENTKTVVDENKEAKVIVLTEEEFKTQIWNYDESPQAWVYKGDLPAVIDFYADWCGPCKRVAPIMEKLAKEYDGKINIYKINTDHNRELSGVFGIKSIPSILFIPKKGQPAMQAGAMQEDQYRQIFEDYVLGKKKVTEEKK
ncbi:MAG: thioredoxin [Bacteroidetes bacterium 4572_77]|nr:MAG: thioredoxin [Bacteroidetes bacterium 4572_77]